jgi:hypothetical protein
LHGFAHADAQMACPEVIVLLLCPLLELEHPPAQTNNPQRNATTAAPRTQSLCPPMGHPLFSGEASGADYPRP